VVTSAESNPRYKEGDHQGAAEKLRVNIIAVLASAFNGAFQRFLQTHDSPINWSHAPKNFTPMAVLEYGAEPVGNALLFIVVLVRSKKDTAKTYSSIG